MNTDQNPSSINDGYNEGQAPMARTGARRGMILGLVAFVVVMALIVINARHEINETAAPAANQSAAVAPKQ